MKDQQGWRPNKIKILSTKEKLTNATGLGSLVEIFDGSSLREEFKKCLPERKSPRSLGSYRLGLIQVSSFLYGHDCIDDLEEFREDPALEAVMSGETVAPRTMGDFLREFEDEHLKGFNNFLQLQVKAYRKHLVKSYPEKFKAVPHLSIDSTHHEQESEKMEGLAYNYDNKWGLSSEVIFDEIGMNWAMDLRAGNAKSGFDVKGLIEGAFRGYKFSDEKYLSGDAAYCNQEVIRTCMGLGVKFTFTANQATTGWEDHISEVKTWKKWEYKKEEKEKAQKRGEVLPDVELGTFHWWPSWAEGKICLNVVIKRTRVEQLTLLEEGWKYYGVITNLSLFKRELQEVIEFHNKRGNAENFIREEKYGYDLKHFPCQKLKANGAFCGLAMVAHNLLRWVALMEKPDKPHFSKKLRRRFIYIPGKVVRHARQVFFKIPEHFKKEVDRLRQVWQATPIPAFTINTG